MAESTQKKLGRVRPPRVQITYDVETGGAFEKKELPFLVGIMADLSGKPEEPLPKIRDRRFVEIDRDNFNDIMSSIEPRLAFAVDNKLVDDDSKLQVELRFNHIDDFDALPVVEQVAPLRQLYDARRRLSDLLTKLDGNDTLDALLQDVIENSDQREEIKKEVATAAESASGEGDAGDDTGGDSGDEAPKEE